MRKFGLLNAALLLLLRHFIIAPHGLFIVDYSRRSVLWSIIVVAPTIITRLFKTAYRCTILRLYNIVGVFANGVIIISPAAAIVAIYGTRWLSVVLWLYYYPFLILPATGSVIVSPFPDIAALPVA